MQDVRDAGFRRWDVHTPYPVHGMDAAMGLKNSKVGWFSFLGGVTGFDFADFLLGLPTRIAYGLHLFPKNLPCHCKLEAFLPPYGWVSFDVSETQRFIKLIELSPDLKAEEKAALAKAAAERLRAGFRDNTWIGSYD